jgi:hypothetical protein
LITSEATSATIGTAGGINAIVTAMNVHHANINVQQNG